MTVHINHRLQSFSFHGFPRATVQCSYSICNVSVNRCLLKRRTIRRGQILCKQRNVIEWRFSETISLFLYLFVVNNSVQWIITVLYCSLPGPIFRYCQLAIYTLHLFLLTICKFLSLPGYYLDIIVSICKNLTYVKTKTQLYFIILFPCTSLILQLKVCAYRYFSSLSVYSSLFYWYWCSVSAYSTITSRLHHLDWSTRSCSKKVVDFLGA